MNIFLCYSSQDKPFARKLAADLRVHGVHVWIDEGELNLGDSLIGRIEGALQEVKSLGVILSKAAVRSAWVRKEVRIAFELENDGQLLVLPLLYEDCELPVFLKDRRRIDFRNPLNYQVAVTNIVSQLNWGGGRKEEDIEFDRKVMDLEFTRSWQTVVILDSYSEEFVRLCETTLARLKPNSPSWDEHIASSFAEFVTTVLRAREIARGAWVTLCRLVESERIPELLRYWTLDRMAVATFSGLVRADRWGIPKVLRTGGVDAKARDLFAACLEHFFDPSKVNLQGSDRSGALRVLALLWRYGNPDIRKAMVSRIALYMDREEPGASASLKVFAEVKERNGKTVEDALNEIRESWTRIGMGGVKSDRRKIEVITERIVEDGDIDDILDILRREPKRIGSERHDFEIFMSAGRIFTPPFLNAIRQHQGEGALYGFLVSVVTDVAIDLEFSIIGLMTLVQEFGIEGLLLDDRIPDGVLALRGQHPNRYCAVDILCEGITSAERGVTWAAYAMIALHGSFDDEKKARLRAVVESHVKDSERLRAVAAYLDSRISEDALEAALNR